MGITLSELGGAQKVVYELLSALEEEKYDLTVVTAPNGELVEWIKQLNQKRTNQIKLFTLPYICREINLLNDLKLFLKLWRIMAFHRFDTVHFHSSKMGLLGPVAAFLAGIRRILFTVHGWGINELQSSLFQRILGGLTGLANRLCSTVICVSAQVRNWGLTQRWLVASKSLVIHNGMEEAPTEREKLLAELGTSKKLIVGTICRLADPKEPLFTIQAAQQLRKRGHDFQMVIIGDGPLRQQCENAVAASKLEAVVRLLGTREDARELLNDVDIFVLFSKTEALPLTVIEAMFAGKPVVASDVGGMSELIDHGDNGYLIQRGALDEAVDYIEGLLNDPDLRQRMGRSASQKAYQYFSKAKMVKEYEKIYLHSINMFIL